MIFGCRVGSWTTVSARCSCNSQVATARHADVTGHFPCFVKASDICQLGLDLVDSLDVMCIELNVASVRRIINLAISNCIVIGRLRQATSWEHRPELGGLAQAIGNDCPRCRSQVYANLRMRMRASVNDIGDPNHG